MNRVKHSIKIIILAVLFGNCNGTYPPGWDSCKSLKIEQTASHNVPTTDHLVVYLDTSASMAGYVSPNGGNSFSAAPDGQTAFSKTLLELRNVVTTMSPQPQVVVRRVDTSISTPSYSDLDLSQAALNRGIYSGKETNLAGAIKTFSAPLNEESEEKTPPRFHILVTDGVQSSKNNNDDVSCAQGSDSFCVKKQLLELINNGWGGAVLGMRSEFQGNVYSEITNQTISYSSGKDAAKYRPFYLYIFSPDRAALDKLLLSLRQKLSTLGKQDSFRAYNLTSEYKNGAASVDILQDGQSKELLDVISVDDDDCKNPCIEAKVNLDTETEGPRKFVLSIKPDWTESALSSGSAEELLKLLKWELKPVYPEAEEPDHRYPNFKLVTQEIKKDQAELTFETGWSIESGPADWRMFHLVGSLDVENPTPPWVSAWTTNIDTTTDAANRTLNIESSLANLWKNSTLENYPVAEVCIRVGEN